jgi:hypothetical protein
MFERTTRATLFAAYQTSLLLAILLLPFAAGARRLGLPAPTGLGGAVESLGAVYDSRR